MLPAFNSLQHLSNKDKKLAFSITFRQRLRITSESFFSFPSKEESSENMTENIHQLFSLPFLIFKQDGANINRAFGQIPNQNSELCISTSFALPSVYCSCESLPTPD